MGHSRELLDQIAADVASAWPAAAGFRMEFERPLPGVRGMLPDIQVVDPLGKVRCVVEIGYTRPEKLTHYRESGIEDVRWYDKAGKLHADVNAGREVDPVRLKFRQVTLFGRATCWRCVLNTVAEACGPDHDVDGCACDDDDIHDDAAEEHRYTRLTVLSGGGRWIGLVYCDECDTTTTLIDEDELMMAAGWENQADFDAAHEEYRTDEHDDIEPALYGAPLWDEPLSAPELDYRQARRLAADYFGESIQYRQFTEWGSAPLFLSGVALGEAPTPTGAEGRR